ncbi:MAG: hypothetical protein IKN59_06900 [Paludibacteraceae bacterium]|nr:hypothetical protein [Paludibacteraceae bacterium]
MKKSFLILFSILLSATACGVKPRPLVYFGDTLEWNTEWRRQQCGMIKPAIGLPEVSGIACSRVTPGYIWMQSDDYESKIVATDEKGINNYKTVKFSKSIRWDWEDMSGGVYNDTNYLFIGAFGDNDETDGNYSIVYLKEPAIGDVAEETVVPRTIKFVYPDGHKHNCEALMYDNIDERIYIITKVYYNVCQVFYMPFRLDYGDETQTLTYVCDLGVISDIGVNSKNQRCMGFHLVTAADISPDGKYILIKNHNNIVALYSWILLFTREEGESVAETLIRQRKPEPLYCYEYEWQGEAICWLDSTTFYTTSDSDGEPPIYKYTKSATALMGVPADRSTNRLVSHNGILYIRHEDTLYTLTGQKVE